jgi:uncharacterized membrane protein YphA (DoxX/SURF4 family)
MIPTLQAIAAALALILLLASFSKLDAWAKWTRTSARLIPLPRPADRLVRVLVPSAEFIAAVLLLTRPLEGLLMSSILFSLFTASVALLTLRHRDEECGCFGNASRSRINWKLGVRNALLAGLAIGAVIAAKDVDVPAPPGLRLIAILLIGLVTLTGIEWRQLHRTSPTDQSHGGGA